MMMDIGSLELKVPNNKSTGRPTFNTKDLLKLCVYGCFNGIISSRKLAKMKDIAKSKIREYLHDL